jgi:hypothetical protein
VVVVENNRVERVDVEDYQDKDFLDYSYVVVHNLADHNNLLVDLVYQCLDKYCIQK